MHLNLEDLFSSVCTATRITLCLDIITSTFSFDATQGYKQPIYSTTARFIFAAPQGSMQQIYATSASLKYLQLWMHLPPTLDATTLA